MRHLKRGRKLGRNSSHRRALCRNMLINLFAKGQIITTVAKAKEYAPIADKMISLAKRADKKIKEMEDNVRKAAGDDVTSEIEKQIEKNAQAIKVNYLRRLIAKLRNKPIAEKLFYEIAPLYSDRNGGYTSVLLLNKGRLGDNAPRAVMKLVVDLPGEGQRSKTSDAKKLEKEKRKKEKAEIKRKQRERKAKEKEKQRQKKEKEKQKKLEEKQKKDGK